MANRQPIPGSGQHWDDVADAWVTWVRTPGHDIFWSYRDEFRRFVPAPGERTLEVGCGEGRISRELTDLGHRVTAADASPRLLAAAEAAGSAAAYELADAAALPFADGSFDRVVLYNMLMDVPDMPAAVAEAGRVLAPGGVLTLSVVHPFTDRGHLVEEPEPEPEPGVSSARGRPPAAFTIPGTAASYFDRTEFDGAETRDGLSMHFHGWAHPLQDYVGALHAAGLVISELREPRPAPDGDASDGSVPDGSTPDGDAGGGDRLEAWRRLPLFLWINATRPESSA